MNSMVLAPGGLSSRFSQVDSMRKVSIYIGGKDKRDWTSEGVNHFVKLLKQYALISIENIALEGKGGSAKRKSPLARVQSDSPIIVLDESGTSYDSESFGDLVIDLIGTKGKLSFFIGGPEGFSETMLRDAKNIVSLSEMTFGHRLSLIILLEQLYRAFDARSKGKYRR